MKPMVIAVLLSCFLLNVITHGNLPVSFLNTLLLFFSIVFYLKFSARKISTNKSLRFISPIFILIAATPLFIYKHDVFVLLSALGIVPLFLLYLHTKVKLILIPVIFFYLILISLYANEIITFPFALRKEWFLSSDYWTNLYTQEMAKEALYLPYKVRPWVFNDSVYFYAMLSKAAGIFMPGNFYETLLLANLYPLIKGLVLDFNNWNKHKTFVIFCMLLIAIATTSSRIVNISNTFVFLAPFLMYFVLRGLNSINKIVYLGLFIFSIIIATSPT